MKILYVEDEIAHVELTQRTLEDNLQDGFVLLHAESLRDAIKVIETESDIDLVLTDLRLPDGSGLDILKKVQVLSSPPAVVLVTGQGDQEVAVAALKAGAADYLVKQSDYLHRLPVVISNAVAQNRLAHEQAALREAQARFRTLVEQIPAAVYTDLADQHITRIYISPQIEGISGYSPQEWTQSSQFVKTIIHPEDKARFIEEDEFTNQTSTPFNLEYRIIRKDGQIRTIHDTATLVHDENGKPLYWQGIIFDITKERESQETIKASESSYRGLFNSISQAIYIHDKEGRFLDVNDGAVLMYGYPREFFIGKTPEALSAPGKNNLNEVKKKLEKAFLGKPQEFEFWGIRSNGEVFPKDVTLNKGTYFGQDAVIAIGQDITLRKKAEAVLEYQLKELGVLHSAANAGVQSNSEEEIIESITRITAQLYPEVCGILLLNQEGNLLMPHRSYIGADVSNWQAGYPITMGITGKAVSTGQILKIDDVSKEKDFIEIASNIRSELCVPIRVSERVIGVMNVESKQLAAFDKDDERLLSTIAGGLGTALERLRLFTEERRRANEFAALYATTSKLTAKWDLQSLLDTVLNQAIELLKTTAGGIYLYNPSRRDLEVAVARGVIMRQGTRLQLGEGMAGQVALSHKPIIVDDYNSWENRSAQYANLSIRAVVEVPMLYGGELIGVLAAIEGDESTRNFTQADAELLSLFAAQAASAIENVRLFEAEKQRRQEAETLRETTNKLTASVKLGELFEIILDSLKELIPYDSASIELANQEYYEIVAGRDISIDLIGKRYQIDHNKWGGDEAIRLPVIIHDVQMDDRFEKFEGSEYIHGWMGIPLLTQGRLIGFLNLDSRTPGFYTDKFSALAQTFGNQVATAIENTRLSDEENRRTKIIEAMADIANEIATTREIIPILNKITERALELLRAHNTAIYLLHDDNNTIKVISAQGEHRQQLLARSLKIGEGITGNVVANAKAEIINNMSEDHRKSQIPGTPANESEEETMMSAPLLLRGRCIGAINAWRRQADGLFNQTELDFLIGIGNQVSIAIESARLFQETIRRGQEAAAIAEVGRDISSTLQLDIVLERIATYAKDLLYADTSAVFLAAPNKPILSAIAAVGESAREIKNDPLELGKGILGNIALHEVGEVVNYTINDPRSILIKDTEFDPNEHIMGVPILSKDQHSGLVAVWRSGKDKEFLQSDLEFLNSLAQQAATAIENARLYNETQLRLNDLEVINRISTALRSTKSLDEMLPIFLDETLKLLQSEHGSLWLYDSARDELVQRIARGLPIEFKIQRIKPTEGILGHVFSSGTVYISEEFALDPLLFKGNLEQTPPSLGGICVPIQSTAGPVGAILIEMDKNKQTTNQTGLLTTLAEIAGNAIYRAELYEQSQEQIQKLTTLRDIDAAIASSTDLRVTLNILMDHTLKHLKTDAVDIMLYHHELQSLTYLCSAGFNTLSPSRPLMRLGEGLAGQVVMKGGIEQVPDLRLSNEAKRDPLLIREGFITYIGIPLIVKGQTKGVFEIFHRSFFTPTTEWMQFLQTLAGQAAIAIDNSQLFDHLQRSNQEVTQAYDTTLEGWARALELRDRETEGHTRRVTELTMQLARHMRIPEADLVNIYRGVLLHDIGKMGVPDQILRKTGPLIESEWVEMRKHPEYAFNLLAPIPYLRPALDIPYCHHEHWDGSGYPRGLKGEQIPLSARIFSIVDIWDALLSDRIYRKAWPEAKVLEYLKELSGTILDPKVVIEFLRMIGEPK